MPSGDLRHDLFTDFAVQFRSGLHIVQAFNLLSNIPLAHTAGVQDKDLVLHAFSIAVVLSNDFRLVIALAISGELDVNFAQLGLDRLLRIPIAVVGSSGVPGRPLTAFSHNLGPCRLQCLRAQLPKLVVELLLRDPALPEKLPDC